MNQIRVIPHEDFGQFVDIMADAYPGMPIVTEEEKKRIRERLIKRSDDIRISVHGLYRGNKLLGGLRLFDYTMNLFGVKVLAGGGGTLGVSLVHKKEHVAKDLMEYFVRYYRKKQSPITLLWPFRPDFYKKMGWGIGSQVHVYSVKPESIPCGKSKKHIRFLNIDDAQILNDCYNRYVDTRTGLIEETLLGRQTEFEAYKNHKYIGYEKDGRIHGYLIFVFERGKASMLDNNIRVIECVYETPEVLSELMTFLHTQFDQISRIVIQTVDENFYHFLKDPRNHTGELFYSVNHETNISGVGVMFRVIDTKRLFEMLKDHSFGGQNCKLKLTIKDDFLKVNSGSLIIHFVNGKPRVKEKNAAFEVELKLNIADFSSLVLGAVNLKSLYNYGLVQISSEAYLEKLNKLFATEHRPVCLTHF